MADSGVKRPKRKRAAGAPAERVSRAMAAKHDLTLLEEAFEVYADTLFGEWMKTEPHETDKRERIHASFRAVGGARQVLMAIINDGALARNEAAMSELLGKAN